MIMIVMIMIVIVMIIMIMMIIMKWRRFGCKPGRWLCAHLGWHYLSDASCLLRPHLFSTA